MNIKFTDRKIYIQVLAITDKKSYYIISGTKKIAVDRIYFKA